jgi:hypothetical protein
VRLDPEQADKEIGVAAMDDSSNFPRQNEVLRAPFAEPEQKASVFHRTHEIPRRTRE